MGLTSTNTKQLNMFVNENPKHKPLMKVIDKINNELGIKKVKLASQKLDITFDMRQNMLSKRYTTNWNELLEVE